jgi:hypothetical protein
MNQWKVSGNGQNVMYLFMGSISLFAFLNAFSSSHLIAGSGFWLLGVPLVLLLVYGLLKLFQSTYISIEDEQFIVQRGNTKTKYSCKEISLTYGRFTYPNMGAYGTVIFVKAAKKRYRFAVPKLLFAPEFYTEGDGYAYDFMLQEQEGKALSGKLTEATKENSMIRLESQASPFRAGNAVLTAEQPHALQGNYRADFSIELRRSMGALQIITYICIMMALVGLLNGIIFVVEPFVGVLNAQFIGFAFFIPCLLYGIFSMTKGSGASHILQSQGGVITLSSKNKIEAQCNAEELIVKRGFYTMSGKGGTFTYPVVSIKFAERKAMKLGTYDHSPWGKNGENMGSPTYVIGPPEFELFSKSFGLN